jgi:hypothetical protein
MRFSFLPLLLFISGMAHATCPTLQLPSAFELNEKSADNGRDFIIKSSSGKIGTISMKNPRGRFSFEIRNAKKELIARAREEDRGDDSRIEVVDCENRSLGSIRARDWRNSFHLNKEYKILDGVGREQGMARKNEFLAAEFQVRSYNDELCMEIHQPAIDFFKDSWNLKFFSAAVDPRVALLLPAYRTSVKYREKLIEEERERREERREDNKDRKKKKKKAKKKEKRERKNRD